MPRPGGNILSDIGEQFAELGKSTVKSTGKALKQTFSPLSMAESVLKGTQTEGKQTENQEKGPGKDHTPLDIQKLQEKQSKSDSSQLDSLRQSLFQMTKKDEQTAIDANRKQNEARMQEANDKEQRKKQNEMKTQISQEENEVHGKERKSLFSPKKKAQQKHTETKPSVSKD